MVMLSALLVAMEVIAAIIRQVTVQVSVSTWRTSLVQSTSHSQNLPSGIFLLSGAFINVHHKSDNIGTIRIFFVLHFPSCPSVQFVGICILLPAVVFMHSL